jgi:hypothetical protein
MVPSSPIRHGATVSQDPPVSIVHHGRLEAGVPMIGKPDTFAELGAKNRALLDT